MAIERAKVIVRGVVQGVGFRPFVCRLAGQLGLCGWASNSSQGVVLEVEGPRPQLNQFLLRLEQDKPQRAIIHSLEFSFLDARGFAGFEIRQSAGDTPKTTFISPDIATCSACLAEMLDPADRRYLYPFTNCTNCGPRFSIIQALPYDRANTSMKHFTMCPECDHEYHDPASRRFHAQPNACPVCGPRLALWDPAGRTLANDHKALIQAAQTIRAGAVLALKGLGGFQLIADARNESAVCLLRARKHREEKPFALMFPSLDAVKAHCGVSLLEERLLRAPEAPIVLLRRRHCAASPTPLATSIAPWNPNLGVLLPYTPLHHLLMRELGFPVVATSGNLSDEPLCTDEHEALERLLGLADLFLVHHRPILRHVDDSVVRVVLDRELVLRRARGYAPLPLTVRGTRETSPVRDTEDRGRTILAVGAHLKNAVALAIGPRVFISQHVGDLETRQAYSAFCTVAADLERLYDASPDLVACDLHPEYLSTKYARARAAPVLAVQHHYAHVASCMAENELDGAVLGVCWDGTGHGLDGTVWGGEFLLTDETSFTRVAHFRQFSLPGGEASIREPRRTALGLLHVLFGDRVFRRHDLFPVRSFSRSELALLRQMLDRRLKSPITSSVGRLFDGIASLVGIRQRVRFEGQAAIELECSLERAGNDAYPFTLTAGHPLIVDWEPTIRGVIDDLATGATIGAISARFHNMLVEALVQVARKVGEPKVVLTGGCFQNRYLTEQTVHRLQQEGFRPYWHQRVPPNDGGIALGQVWAAARARQLQPTAEEAVVR